MLHTLEAEVLLLRNSGDALDGPMAWEDELLCDGWGRGERCFLPRRVHMAVCGWL